MSIFAHTQRWIQLPDIPNIWKTDYKDRARHTKMPLFSFYYSLWPENRWMTEGAFLPCESLIVTLLDSLHSVRVSVDCLSPQVGLENVQSTCRAALRCREATQNKRWRWFWCKTVNQPLTLSACWTCWDVQRQFSDNMAPEIKQIHTHTHLKGHSANFTPQTQLIQQPWMNSEITPLLSYSTAPSTANMQ